MKRILHTVLATCVLSLCSTLTAQERGMWRAASPNARAITGDLILSDEKITINFSSFTMVRVRDLDKAELTSAFNAEGSAKGIGSLYRLDVPAAKIFLHKNTLCGTDQTQWMATYLMGRSLKLAFFSSQKPPVLNMDAMTNSSDLCGVFSYSY